MQHLENKVIPAINPNKSPEKWITKVKICSTRLLYQSKTCLYKINQSPMKGNTKEAKNQRKRRNQKGGKIRKTSFLLCSSTAKRARPSIWALFWWPLQLWTPPGFILMIWPSPHRPTSLDAHRTTATTARAAQNLLSFIGTPVKKRSLSSPTARNGFLRENSSFCLPKR